METIKIKPEKELKTLWLITWTIWLVAGVLLLTPLFFIGIESWIALTSIVVYILILIPVLIWINAAFNAIEYCIDDEGVKMKGGAVWKKHVTVPYSKITNVDVTQGPMQRYFNVGTIHVQTAGAGGQQGQKAELKINGIREMDKIKDIIIKKVKEVTYPLSNTRVAKDEREPFRGSSVQVNSQVFEDILNELREIKALLEKREEN
ncbi:MAG: PH domain-containing protein [Actinomycetota bacterium]|nr:PH domain-containing protein [Actinomycetota bacterium]